MPFHQYHTRTAIQDVRRLNVVRERGRALKKRAAEKDKRKAALAELGLGITV